MAKRIYFFSFLFFIVASVSLFANVSSEFGFNGSRSMSSTKGVEEDIELSGSLAENTLKSGFQPISIFKSNDYVRIEILESNLGNVNIKIIDEYGASVYQDNINASIQKELLINISDWKEGNYSIQSYKTENCRLEGNFNICEYAQRNIK